MSESWLEGIGRTRKTLIELISARGFTTPPALGEMSSERLNIMVSLFRQSNGKDRPPTLDIHVVNRDSQIYVAWLREDKLEKDYKSAYKYFTEKCSPSLDDDLVLVVVSIDVPSPEAYSFESSNVSVFSLATLTVNITKHKLVPKHELLGTLEARKVMRKLSVKSGQLPQITRFTDSNGVGDPVARFYGCRPGDILRITRHSVTSGKHIAFREVVGFEPGSVALGRMDMQTNLRLSPEQGMELEIKASLPDDAPRPTTNANLPPSDMSLGETSYKGPNYSFSFHGHPMQLLKSMIQKTIRRSDIDSAIWLAAEVSSFHQLNVELIHTQRLLNNSGADIDSIITQKKSILDRLITAADLKAIPSFTKRDWQAWLISKQSGLVSLLRNYIHRLMIISVEDCFSGWLSNKIDTLLRDLINDVTSIEFPSKLALIHLYLIESTKIRLTSDIKSVYMLPGKSVASPTYLQRYKKLSTNPEDFNIDGVLGVQVSLLLKQIQQLPEIFHEEMQEDVSKLIFKTRLNFVLKEETDIKIAALGIIDNLTRQSDHVFYWINKLLTIRNGCVPQPTGRGGKSSQCVYLLWKILQEFVGALNDNEIVLPSAEIEKGLLDNLKGTIDTLRSWYFDGNLGAGKTTYELPEAKLFLYYSYLLYNRISSINFSLGKDLTGPTFEQLRDIRKTQDVDIPGYAKDMHVSKYANQINRKINELLDNLKETKNDDLGKFISQNYTSINSFVSEEDDLQEIDQKSKEGTLTTSELERFLRSEVRDQVHFARVAAQVKNELTSLVDIRYRTIYNSLKHSKELDISSEKKKKIISEGEEGVVLKSLDDIVPIIGGKGDKLIQGVPVYEISAATEKRIIDNPQGQKLCGSGKMRVLLFRKQVVKGPYQKDSIKLQLNIDNTCLLHSLEEYLNIPLIKRSCLKWTCFLQIENRIYLVSPNVGDAIITLMPQSEADTKIESGRQIAVRGGYIESVAGLLRARKGNADIEVATLQHFYLRYLMGIGDSNLNQVLVRRDSTSQLVAGIDMEEKRSREATGNYFTLLFSKAPAKDIRVQLGPLIKRIIQFPNSTLDSILVNLLEKYNVSPELFRQRIERFHKAHLS